MRLNPVFVTVLTMLIVTPVFPAMASQEIPENAEQSDRVQEEKKDKLGLAITAGFDLAEYYKDQGIKTGVIQPFVKAGFAGFYAGSMFNYDARGTKKITEIDTMLGYEYAADIFSASVEYVYYAYMELPEIQTACENELNLSVSADVITRPSFTYTRCMNEGVNYLYAGLSHSFELPGGNLSVSPVLEFVIDDGYAGFTELETVFSKSFEPAEAFEMSVYSVWTVALDGGLTESSLFFGLSFSFEAGL